MLGRATMETVNAARRLRSVRAETDTTTDPAELLDLAGRGSEEAFGSFYDLTSQLVYGIVLRVLRDPAMAEEVTQEVYVELWQLAPRFDPARGSARSWTATVAHRRAVDRVRSEQARRAREEADSHRAARAADSVVEEVLDELDRSRVRTALDELSDPQREAVTLAYYGGHSYREVAALLRIPEGTVKTRIRDGLIRLRDDLGVAP